MAPVQAIAAEVIGLVVTRSEFDVVADLGNVIPARFIVDYLGFDQEQRDPLVDAMRAVAAAGPEDIEQIQMTVGRACWTWLPAAARKRPTTWPPTW